jgi:hypothetical protein
LHAALGLLVGFVGGALVYAVSGSGWAGVAGAILFAGGYYATAMRRYIRRRRLAARPFPETWRRQLLRCVPFYRKLDDEGRRRFENDVRFFVAEQRIYGIRGAPVTDEIKVLIAASAAMLCHGWPDWEWPTMRDIVVYPTAFDEEYRIGASRHMAGMVHQQGPIIFSERDLRHSFSRPGDGLNVGLHEFAHVLDMAGGAADGVPAGVAWVASAPWVQVIADRMQRVRRNECRRVLRAYAGVNEAEFFAVAVETFFEQPARLRAHDPELYGLLAEYFNLDPAGESERLGRRDPAAPGEQAGAAPERPC